MVCRHLCHLVFDIAAHANNLCARFSLVGNRDVTEGDRVRRLVARSIGRLGDDGYLDGIGALAERQTPGAGDAPALARAEFAGRSRARYRRTVVRGDRPYLYR
ncbi:hypothetical protein ACFQH8_10660 [Halomicroarcula sp. GCM10025710]